MAGTARDNWAYEESKLAADAAEINKEMGLTINSDGFRNDWAGWEDLDDE